MHGYAYTADTAGAICFLNVLRAVTVQHFAHSIFDRTLQNILLTIDFQWFVRVNNVCHTWSGAHL